MNEWIDAGRSLCVRLLKSGLWNKLYTRVTKLVTEGDPESLVKKLLIFVAVAAVLGFIADQVLYWTRADHTYWMLKPWRLFRGGKEMTEREGKEHGEN